VESGDGRLVIRQEGEDPKDVCAITLSNPEELETFFQGLRRILASLEYPGDNAARLAARPLAAPSRAPSTSSLQDRSPDEREAIVEQARQRNPQAFTPWTREEEAEVRRRYEAGDPIPTIARARKRSARAIELRLQRMGAMPRES
jgi:hypothetical protein